MNGKTCILTSKNRVLTCDFSCQNGRPRKKPPADECTYGDLGIGIG